MEPKYLLVHESRGSYPFGEFAIYEQTILDGQIVRKSHRRYKDFEQALAELSVLNDGEPVILAYSSKPIDNVYDLSKD